MNRFLGPEGISACEPTSIAFQDSSSNSTRSQYLNTNFSINHRTPLKFGFSLSFCIEQGNFQSVGRGRHTNFPICIASLKVMTAIVYFRLVRYLELAADNTALAEVTLLVICWLSLAWWKSKRRGIPMQWKTALRSPLTLGVCTYLMVGMNMKIYKYKAGPLRSCFSHFHFCKPLEADMLWLLCSNGCVQMRLWKFIATLIMTPNFNHPFPSRAEGDPLPIYLLSVECPACVGDNPEYQCKMKKRWVF